jgi:hypothetical protein
MASSVIAALGLVALSQSVGVWILAAATLYGLGKTFFWPTMLGVVAEQFPRGGALTLNATGGVGMLGVGVVGAVFLGAIQDTTVSRELREQQPQLAEKVIVDKASVFGTIEAPDPDKKAGLPAGEQAEITTIEAAAKKEALFTVAIFPVIMFVCYLILFLYFKSRGGYEQVHLDMERTNDMLGTPVGTVEK